MIATGGGSLIVDEPAAVGVAVEVDPEVGLSFHHRGSQRIEVRLDQRVRFVREITRHLEVEGNDLQARDALEDLGEEHAGHAARRVDHHLQPPFAIADGRGEPLEQEIAVGRPEVPVLEATAGRLDPLSIRHRRESLDLLEPGSRPDRPGVSSRDLESVVFRGVVTRGHLDPAGRIEVIDREVDHRRVHETHVHHAGSGVAQALDERIPQRDGTRSHVPTDHDRPSHRIEPSRLRRGIQQVPRGGVADLPGDLLVQRPGVDRPDVVGLEDFADHDSMGSMGSIGRAGAMSLPETIRGQSGSRVENTPFSTRFEGSVANRPRFTRASRHCLHGSVPVSSSFLRTFGIRRSPGSRRPWRASIDPRGSPANPIVDRIARPTRKKRPRAIPRAANSRPRHREDRRCRCSSVRHRGPEGRLPCHW